MRVKHKFLRTLFLFGIISASATALAQETKPEYLHHWRAGFGLNGGIPLNNNYNFSLGVDGRLQYDLTMKTSLAATTGYTHLFSSGSDAGFIPAKLGFKSFLGNQFYVLGEVGGAFGVTKELGNSFLWTPGIGVATKHIDISLRYENYNDYDTGQISLRLAYGYKL
ncbi:hypothetical protein [Flavobacterium suncheonense]|uniref:Outer membrane protein beta-barrel domain-containing protein n=1 Tax=Flavobacterium suncheonense GH29-5 = DSM 17707 TaxID=1121899 RepID=A0A0A2MD74_9FLAO|nr:hypothetical protein [Flavobacterium suncheonense]KGO90204.1 hypothetical protein Q764_03855 [Flavobacterium suncheonense GH29-5 = DSM 17707]